MKNLKRALSLALATVMTMGMMMVGTGAAAPDVDVTSHNIEAIEVMNAIGVMIGDENGNFNPDAPVTRQEMAVVMCNLLGLNPDDFDGTCKFDDVADWAENYVAACNANGIVAGISDTEFGAKDNVTVAQAALMMQKALGYFQNQQDFGEDWKLATVKNAAEINLFEKLGASADKAMTRNDVAQLALNTLKSDVVRFTGTLGTDITTSDGTKVTIGYESEYTARTATGSIDYNTAGSGTHDGANLQLTEKLFENKLQLNNGATDDMNRPATEWTFKGNTVGSYSIEPDYVVVVSKDGKKVKEILDDINVNFDSTTKDPDGAGSATAGQIVSINGGTYENTTATGLKIGDVVEIFMDANVVRQVNAVAVTQYTGDKVEGAVVYKGEGENLKVRVPGVVGTYTSVEKVFGYENLEKDDVVYTWKDKKNNIYIELADSFEGELTGVKTDSNAANNGYIINDETFKVNGNVASITGVTTSAVYNTGFEYFVDANGYLIDAKQIEEAQSDYVIIDKLAYVFGDGSIAGGTRVEAKLVMMDGSTEIVTINSINDGTTKYTGISGNISNNPADASVNGTDKYMAYDNAKSDATVDMILNATMAGLAKNMVFTYTVDNDGKYDLVKFVDPDGSDDVAYATGAIINDNDNTKADIATNAATMGLASSAVAVNENTVFIIANKASNATGYNTYVGKSNVPNVNFTAASGAVADTLYVTKNGIATHVFVGSFATSTVMGDTVYILDTNKVAFRSEKNADGTTYYYNEYHAIVDGEATLIKVNALANKTDKVSDGSTDTTVNALGKGSFAPTYDKNGVITVLTADPADVTGAQSYVMDAGTLVVDGSATYSCADDAVVYLVDSSFNVAETVASELTLDKNDTVAVVKTDSTKAVVKYLVIFTMDDNVTGLKINDGTSDLTFTENTTTGIKEATTASGATALTLTKTDGKSDVKYTAAITTPSTAPADSAYSNTYSSGTVSVTGGNDYYFQVTAVDGTVQIYKVTVTA